MGTPVERRRPRAGTLMRRLWLKLRRRRRLHDDLEEELAFHREMSASHGNPIPLGNTTAITEEALDLWRFTRLENLWRDVVYAFRGLRRSPAFTASAILSLGLGLGVNATVFALGVELLLSRPSVSDPGSLTEIRVGGSSVANSRVFDFVQRSGVFASVVGENEETFMNWNDGHETHRLFSVVTSRNYFTALGVPMAYGRGILPSDPADVVVLRDGFWRRAFNANPAVVGTRILLEGRPYLVVGILPPSHRTLLGFGFSPDVYVPAYLADTMLGMYARLKPGMSLDEAQAALQTVAATIDRTYPQEYKYANNCSVMPVSGVARVAREPMVRAVGLFFAVLLAVAALVLVIACMNVSGLLLARASARRRELAIRLSLGASRGRLVQQLLVESLLLSAAGAVAGALIAESVAQLLGRIHLPLPLPIVLQVAPDWRVFAYATALSALAAVVAGMLPAWQAVRESIATNLPRTHRQRIRRVLVAAQVAVSVVLLATSVLFFRNLLASSAIDPGFDLAHTIRAEISLPSGRYDTPQAIAGYVDRVLPALAAVPGIELAAAARVLPFLDQTRFGSPLRLPDGHEEQVLFHWNAVTPDYFKAMEIPVREGRGFGTSDTGAEPVVVVNRVFAERYFAGRAPVGLTFRWGRDTDKTYRIVGVVEGTKTVSVGEDDQPQLYEPLAQIASDRRRFHLVLRASVPPATELKAVRDVLHRIDPSAGVEVATLFSSIGLAFLPSQVGAVLLGAIGVLGLTLAAMGVYGMAAYSVARRVPEIGVRVALGATRRDIARLVLSESARVVGLGMIVGLLAALLVMRPLALFLMPGLTTSDPATLVVVLVVLMAVGLAASWGPARRAAGVDPTTALRCE
jgi:putative ABC transport system permease protein